MMNTGIVVGIAGMLGGALLIVEYRLIGSNIDAAIAAAGIVMLVVGTGILLFQSRR